VRRALARLLLWSVACVALAGEGVARAVAVDFGAEGLATFFGGGEGCPPPGDAEGEVPELRAQFQAQLQRANHCGAAAVAEALMDERSSARFGEEEWAELAIDEYLRAKDFHRATVVGIRWLKNNPGAPRSRRERARFKILRAAFFASEEPGPKNSPEWLGQLLDYPPYAPDAGAVPYMSFAAFDRDFPQSPFAALATTMRCRVARKLLAHERLIAEWQVGQGQYFAAILLLERLHSISFVFELQDFQRVLSDLASYNRKFADEIEFPPWIRIGNYRWNDNHLRQVFRLEPDDPLDRARLAAALRSSGAQTAKVLAELRAHPLPSACGPPPHAMP
jgi:hypothetical protein